MKHIKIFALGTVAAIALTGPAFAADKSYNGFTSHHLVDEEPYERTVEKLPADEKLEVREYLDYELREPCQNYQPLPQGFMMKGCDIVRIEPVKVAAAPQPIKRQEARSNVLSDYEINFAFDSAAIEPAAGGTLDQVADEIKKYNPREVTVVGHTDKAGPNDYNEKLSERRAMAVSEALTERGVTNRVIDKQAVGENDPAIDTQDGVALRENRRVVVEFRK